MNIELDDQTKQWLQSKSKPVSLKILHVNSCCAPPIQDVMAYLGKPKDLRNYTEVNIDNCSIFVDKHLSQAEKITLKLIGIGMFKLISARLG